MAGFLLALMGAFIGGCDPIEDAGVQRGWDSLPPVSEVGRDVVVDGHEKVLGPVDWVRVAHNGTVAVAQGQARQVRLFDSSGTAVATVGREGEGPGEFQSVHTGGWKGDTLWVFDPTLGRVSFFGMDGEYEGSVSEISGADDPSSESGLELKSLRIRAAYGGDTLLASGLRPAEEGADVDFEEEFAARLHDGTVDRVVAQVPPRDEEMVYAQTDMGIFPVSLPILATGHWNVSPDGRRIVIATTEFDGTPEGVLRIEVLNDRGDQLLRRGLPFEAQPMHAATVDSLLDHAAAPLPGEGFREVVETEARKRLPEAISPVASAIVGSEDRIWLRLREPEEEGNAWILLDDEGTPSGRLVLEEDEILHAAAGDALWLTSLDETDVPSVVRLHIRALD